MNREQRINEIIEQADRIYEVQNKTTSMSGLLRDCLTTFTDDELDAQYNQIMQDKKSVAKLRLSGISLNLTVADPLNYSKTDFKNKKALLIAIERITTLNPDTVTDTGAGITFKCGIINKGRVDISISASLLEVMNPSNITLNIADIDFSSYGIYEIDTIITGLKRGYILFDQTAFYNLIKQFKQLSMPKEKYTLGISHFHSDLETLTDLIELKLKFLHNSDLKSILKNSLFVLETLSNMTLDKVIKYNKTGITTEARAKITEMFNLIFDFLLWDDQDTAKARVTNNIIGANLMDFMNSGYSGKLPKAHFWNLGNIKEFEVALENSIAQCIYSMQPEDKQESETMMHLLKNPAY